MGASCSAKKNKEQPYLQITIHMWKEKEKKYALFDYSSQESSSHQISTGLCVRLCKAGENVVAVSSNQYVEGAEDLLVIEDQYLKPMSEVWNIVRQQNVYGIQVPNKVELSIGQTIRLGRVKIMLQDACFSQTELTDESEQEDNQNQNYDEKEMNDSEYACRICMSKVGTMNNPLVNPCNCSGSVKYIHIKCLSQWIQNKVRTRELNNIILYYWTQLSCEICKSNYKVDFKFQNRKYSILEFTKPKDAYLVISISHIDKDKEQGLYVINMNNRDSIRIGRVQDNDIRLQDISVSRNHAIISMKKDEQKVCIEDQGSKFGTLIECQNIELPQKSVFQVANSVILLEYLKKSYRPYELPSQYKIIDHKEQQIQKESVLQNSSDDW